MATAHHFPNRAPADARRWPREWRGGNVELHHNFMKTVRRTVEREKTLLLTRAIVSSGICFQESVYCWLVAHIARGISRLSLTCYIDRQ